MLGPTRCPGTLFGISVASMRRERTVTSWRAIHASSVTPPCWIHITRANHLSSTTWREIMPALGDSRNTPRSAAFAIQSRANVVTSPFCSLVRARCPDGRDRLSALPAGGSGCLFLSHRPRSRNNGKRAVSFASASTPASRFQSLLDYPFIATSTNRYNSTSASSRRALGRERPHI